MAASAPEAVARLRYDKRAETWEDLPARTHKALRTAGLSTGEPVASCVEYPRVLRSGTSGAYRQEKSATWVEPGHALRLVLTRPLSPVGDGRYGATGDWSACAEVAWLEGAKVSMASWGGCRSGGGSGSVAPLRVRDAASASELLSPELRREMGEDAEVQAISWNGDTWREVLTAFADHGVSLIVVTADRQAASEETAVHEPWIAQVLRAAVARRERISWPAGGGRKALRKPERRALAPTGRLALGR